MFLCSTIMYNPQLVGGVTVPNGFFSFMNDPSRTLALYGSNITCDWVLGDGAAPDVLCDDYPPVPPA